MALGGLHSRVSLCGLTARLHTVLLLVSKCVEIRVRYPLVGVNVDLGIRPLSYGLLRAERHGALHAGVRNVANHTLREQGLLKLNQLLFTMWWLIGWW